jgi:hypothetical protein
MSKNRRTEKDAAAEAVAEDDRQEKLGHNKIREEEKMLKAAIGFGGFEATFPIDDILELSLRREPGEHSRLFIRGVTTKEAAENILAGGSGTQNISLSAKGERKPYFSGPVSKCAVRRMGDVYEAEAEALGQTVLLDTERMRCSFQNAEMTHEALTRAVLAPYGDTDIIFSGNDKAIGDMFVQYDETDWEFLKRVASNISCKLIPADGYSGIRIRVGLGSGGKAAEANEGRLTIEKDILAYQKDSKNALPAREERGAFRYILHTDKWFELGAPVNAEGKTLYVYSAESELEESLFLHTYTLRDENAFLEPKRENEKLTGLSLFGRVTDIYKDQIAVILDIDKKNENRGSRLFPYSTVYSSPDGSGWYFMPEKGDRITIYLPSASEGDAYARSAVDLPTANPQKRSKPDNKEIYTKFGKSVRMTPNSVDIYADNKLWLRLSADGGAEIRSAKNIFLLADGDISINGGGRISVQGSDIKLTQGSGTLVMDGDNVVADGQEVKVGE